MDHFLNCVMSEDQEESDKVVVSSPPNTCAASLPALCPVAEQNALTPSRAAQPGVVQLRSVTRTACAIPTGHARPNECNCLG